MRAVVIACLLACAGCFTVDTAKTPLLGPDAEEHVIVYNYGWNLFGCLPIVCGNENFDSWCGATFFKDEAKLDLVYGKLVSYAESKNCDIADFSVMKDRFVIFDFFYAPIPWVIQYKEAEVSAILRRKGSLK